MSGRMTYSWKCAGLLFALVAFAVAGCRANDYVGPGTRWTQKRDGRHRELRPDVWDRAHMMAEYQWRHHDLEAQEKELKEIKRQWDVAVRGGDQSKAYALSKQREQMDIRFCRSLVDVRLLRGKLLDSGVRQPGVRLLEIQPQRTASEIRNNIEAYLVHDITREVLIKKQDNFLYEEYGRRL